MTCKPKRKKGYTTSENAVLRLERMRIRTTPESGLALSGGGIRSASFSLGLLQALVAKDKLKKFDYMSTVSGGGYIGCALTWWLSQGLPLLPQKDTSTSSTAGTTSNDFPFGTSTPGPSQESQNIILDFLRFHSSYLIPNHRLNPFSFMAVLLRNVLLSLFIYLGLLVGVVFSLSTLILYFDLWWIAPIVPDWLPGIHNSVQLAFAQVGSIDNIVNRSVARRLFEISLYFGWVFVVGCVLYSLGTLYYQIRQLRSSPEDQYRWSSSRYKKRNSSQRWFGFFFKWTAISFFLGLIPTIDSHLTNSFWTIPIAFSLSLILVFFPFNTNLFQMRKAIDKVRRTLGAAFFFYALLFASYLLSLLIMHPVVDIVEFSLEHGFPLDEFAKYALGLYVVVITLLVFMVFLFVGSFMNVNYLGIHRMYRDRLMELFLPDSDAVLTKVWKPATQANQSVIEAMCQCPNNRPYHLINTNVVLVDSKYKKYRERGGTNYIISPLFCGSDATGWIRSNLYMKKSDPGMTLATAMAISGAAANPNAGAGGSAWTRDRLVSLMMSVLNLRLGYWAPHPDPDNKWREIPNLIYPGISSAFLWEGLHEDSQVLDLTDGGHFENLGLYELIRRRLKLIVLSDGSADPDFEFKALGVSIERAIVDFRVSVEFIPEFDLDNLIPGGFATNTGRNRKWANRGFAVANIAYSDGGTGVLIYIKPTLVHGIGPEVISYKGGGSIFPHEATADQFFDEVQFEAYRELGFFQGVAAMEEVATHGWL